MKRTTAFAVSMMAALMLVAAAPSCKKDNPPKQQTDPMKVPQPPNPTAKIEKPFVPAPEGAPNPPGNLLTNPSFEDDRNGWFYMATSQHWVDFTISNKIAHLGKKSAFLDIMGNDQSPDVRIHGVVQTLNPSRFPDKVSGWYRVEKWKRSSEKMYMQFVIIVWGGHKEYKNYQLRYILAGAKSPPYNMANVHYILAPGTGEEPQMKKWVYFEAPVREDFIKLWGRAPTGYDKINYFFEARFDTKPKEGQTTEAEVYFDDLYVGD